MGYSIDPISANCYPDTTVLINKFDIRTVSQTLCTPSEKATAEPRGHF